METSTQSSSTVNLVVRSVYTPSESLALSVDPQMLVGELKCRLCVEFPSNPPVSSQKLIFGGKICGDREPLVDILVQIQSSQKKEGGDKDSKEPVVFHLLVNSRCIRRNKSEGVKTPVQTQPREAAEAPDSPRPRNADSTPVVSDTPSFNAQPSQFMFNQAPAMTQQQQNLFGRSVLMQQQAIVMQQIQYLQYLLMHQRYQQTTSNNEAQQQPFGAHFAPPYGNFYGMMQPQIFQEQARMQQAQPPVGTMPPTQAHASAAEAPVVPQGRSMFVEMAREVFSLLDFRMALKMAFMLFMIGQDMSTDRILMLGLLSFISYLHITGIFAKVYEVYNRHRSVNAGTVPNAPADVDAPGAPAAAGAAITNRCGMLTRVLRISADRGFVQDVKYFVVGLLLSLVPAWHPQPIQGAAPMHGDALPDDMPIQDI